MEQQTHFFFAVKIPDPIKILMKESMESLKAKFPFKRWVHHEDLHITLAFLGFAPADKLALAMQNLNGGLKGVKSLSLEFDEIGIFGNPRSPRIFWANTKESKELGIIRDKVYEACIKAGFKLETRPFKPHITLARKWNEEETFQPEMLEVWKNLRPVPSIFSSDEVVLYQTHLEKTPKYEVKEVFRLDH